MNRIVFTCGDINGIGPEIVIKSIEVLYKSNHKLIYCCPENVFTDSLKFIKSNLKFDTVKSLDELKNSLEKLSLFLLRDAHLKYGEPTKESGLTSYQSIIKSLDIVDAKLADAIITAPISKLALMYAGINFPGHTELLGDRYNLSDFKMMFLSDEMKCALATIHEKISDVPQLLNETLLDETFQTVISSLKNDFGMQEPKIAVLGLNPHAGENGKIGREEIDIINPVIKKYEKYCSGVFVPDAFFGKKLHLKFDAVIGMFHDQVLIPFKLLNFDKGVNYTSGLPIVRTSPDHGTAYDIAGQGVAKPDSIIEAVKWAEVIINSRRKLNER